ncbi:MAG: DJ-1/PfpI family protein [Streptosporangiaceae bacterium]
MDIAFVLYDGMTALDVIGPYEVLASHPDVTAHFVADRLGPVRCDSGAILHATRTFAELSAADVIVVGGSSRWRDALEHQEMITWLADATATWKSSVCTGSTLLAEAGLLRGRPATTHWAVFDHLTGQGAIATHERVVQDAQVITAAGVSAGIDMALRLAAEIWDETTAKALQLGIEYDPEPPFDAGSPRTAPPEVVELLRGILLA